LFLFKKIVDLQSFLVAEKAKGRSVGFVPTMGALHQGHLSLVEASKKGGHLTVCSIFVNPTQFNQQEDFDKYPRNVALDIEMLVGAGCDVLFHPEPEEMYPDGFTTAKYDFGAITNTLEGEKRPGHFDGVITVVKRLFDAVNPDHAYFGQKDFQQCAVIAGLIQYFGLKVQLHKAPILREASGLAMSSRNTRLSEAEKEDATIIYETLSWIREQLKGGLPVDRLKTEALQKISARLQPEYVEIVDQDSLIPLVPGESAHNAVALVAAWCGNVRLIDNMLLGD
jgi:pantoate--beta-alanine ligase